MFKNKNFIKKKKILNSWTKKITCRSGSSFCASLMGVHRSRRRAKRNVQGVCRDVNVGFAGFLTRLRLADGLLALVCGPVSIFYACVRVGSWISRGFMCLFRGCQRNHRILVRIRLTSVHRFSDRSAGKNNIHKFIFVRFIYIVKNCHTFCLLFHFFKIIFIIQYKFRIKTKKSLRI